MLKFKGFEYQKNEDLSGIIEIAGFGVEI